MSAIDVPDHRTRTARFGGTSAIWSLTAAGLFLGSAVLQLVASLQRWVVFRYSRGEFELEDHLYDYTIPWHPWENIGTAAQFFGAGILLLALGVIAMALGVLAMPRPTTTRHPAVDILLGVFDLVLAILVAGWFVISGAHALISGLNNTPSPLAQYLTLGWVGVVGVIVLCVRWARRSPAATMACLFLLGSTMLGYFIATYQIAPIFAGYISHDTTPWTETIVAVWTAAAGVAMIVAAGDASSRKTQRAASLVPDAAVQGQ